MLQKRWWLVGWLLAVIATGSVAQPSNEALLVKRSAELRENPGDSARSLAPLPLQTTLTRLPARQGAWIQVRTANGTSGWVHMFDVGPAGASSPASNVATGALRGISNFFNRGSAQANTTTSTSTVGIRGLGAEDIAKTVNDAKQGRVEFRLDRLANIHVPLGKVSFDDAKLRENMATFIEAVNAARPKEAKGQYIRSATLTTTMGPGIHLDLAQTLAMRTT